MEQPRGYRGEPIDIQSVLEEIKRLTEQHAWKRDSISVTDEASTRSTDLIAYHRTSNPSLHRVYLSTGIHGDEPAGPLAVLQLLRENIWPRGVDIFLCPCLNLNGFPLSRRENDHGIDLNRDYRDTQSDEVRGHIAWLTRKPRFDVTLCLHEDWESKGFYLYELNPDQQPSLAQKIISRVAEVCPIERSEKIDNWPAENGVIHPNINPADRPQWPEALYLILNKTRLSYTMEAPSEFPLAVRVAALVKGVRAVTETISEFPVVAAEKESGIF
ncbi:MAG: M14 family metallocarboxypeptidase [Verrucomicrobiota bacterium]